MCSGVGGQSSSERGLNSRDIGDVISARLDTGASTPHTAVRAAASRPTAPAQLRLQSRDVRYLPAGPRNKYQVRRAAVMRSKDRLAELRHLSESAGAAVYNDTVAEALKQPAHAQHIDGMFREVERMRSWIHDLNGNTQLLRRLHADPTFHTNKQLQDQLDSVIVSSNAVGLKVCGALRQFEGVASGAQRNDAASRIARLQYAATRALYADALAAHHAALAAVRDHHLALLHEQIKLTNLTISDEECESLLESKNLSLFVDNVKAETADAKRMLREVEARHEELARVEASLRDIRDLFQQLAHLVVAQKNPIILSNQSLRSNVTASYLPLQQEQIDSVEYYALQATEHVESGGHQLLKGTVLRTKTRKKKMSLIICVAVGVFVVLVVLVFT